MIRKRFLAVLIFLFLALPGGASKPGIADPALTSKVTVTFAPCSDDLGEHPRIALKHNGAGDEEQVSVSFRDLGSGITITTFDVAPGYYYVLAKTTHCSSLQTLTVIKGRNRNILMRLGLVQNIFDSDLSLAGSLPVGSVMIDLLPLKDGQPVLFVPERLVVIDEEAFYAEHLTPQLYVLRIRVGGGWRADIPMDLRGEPSSKDLYTRHVVHNITIEEIQTHMAPDAYKI